jgi:hypothetical protein
MSGMPHRRCFAAFRWNRTACAYTKPDLPYGLDTWRQVHVPRIPWADGGAIEVTSFVRHNWKDDPRTL